jgi:hypothetical protein
MPRMKKALYKNTGKKPLSRSLNSTTPRTFLIPKLHKDTSPKKTFNFFFNLLPVAGG